MTFIVKRKYKLGMNLLIPLIIYSILVFILDLSGLVGESFIILAGLSAFDGLILYYYVERSLKLIGSKEKECIQKINDSYKINIENTTNRIIISNFENDLIKKVSIAKYAAGNTIITTLLLAILLSAAVELPLNIYSIFVVIILFIFTIIFLIPAITNIEKINKMENTILESLRSKVDFVEVTKIYYRSLWF